MQKQENSTIISRQKVSDLIFKVLTNDICVRQALENFPEDEEDPSILAAWHALVHYEADEEIRLKNEDYKEEQDDYIEMMAFTLRDGNPLPENIINSYNELYKTTPVKRSKGLKNLLKSLMRYTV